MVGIKLPNLNYSTRKKLLISDAINNRLFSADTHNS